MNLPRPLFLDLSVSYGGSSSRVLGLLRALSSEGAALAGLERSAVMSAASAAGLPVHNLGSHKADPRLAARLTHLIHAYGFQVIDTQNIQSKFWASLSISKSNIALVSTLNSWYADEHGNSLKGLLYGRIEQITNHSLDLYIAVSHIIRERLLVSGIPTEAVSLIPNAVEMDLAAIPFNPAGLRREYGLPNTALVCCAVGRLVSAKGYEDLIDAIREIATDQPNVYCLIVGGGPLREALAGQITRAGLENRIRLLGLRNHAETLSIMRSSDIYVMPSRSEGTPIALLEAGALGIPIVATRAGGIPDLVTHDTQALLVDVGNVGELSHALRRLTSDPALRQRLAREAQAHITQSFGLSAQVEATKAAYQKAWDRSQQRLRGSASKFSHDARGDGV